MSINLLLLQSTEVDIHVSGGSNSTLRGGGGGGGGRLNFFTTHEVRW